jgi:hypothetical protein
MSATLLTARSKFILLIVAVTLALAAYYLSRDNSLRFKEEVQLSSGEIIEIDRVFKTKSLGEIGGPGGWEAAFNSFTISRSASADKPPTWQSEAGLIPMVLDRDPQNGEWFLITTFYTCEAWNKLGRPKLPYAEFQLKNGQWQQGDLSPQWTGRVANVMTGIRSGGEPALLALPEKQIRNMEPKIAPKYRKVVDEWTTGCH